MKPRTKWIICLLIVSLCGSVQANPEILEKFRTSSHRDDYKLVYDLYLMGDEALPFLIKNITNEDRQVRERAIHCLQQYYPHPPALSALTVVFLHGTDNWVRYKAAWTIAAIDAEYTKRLMGKHLNADVETKRIVIAVLLGLKDERVIPFLVEMLENPKISPERRRFAVYGLADFNDKRAVPALLNLLKFSDNVVDLMSKQKVIENLARIDDVRTIPILMEAIDPNSYLGKRFSNSISHKVISALSQSVPARLQALLEVLNQTESKDVRQSIFRVLREVRDPKLAPIFGKIYLETGDPSQKKDADLRSAIARALQNMGDEGFEMLMHVTQQKPDAAVLNALTSFNKKEAVDAVAAFALDKSSPLRYYAIGDLTQFGGLWKEEISKYIPQLLADSNPKVKFLIFDIIHQLKLTDAVPTLKRLTQDPDENIRNAAHLVLDVLSGKTQLKLEIEPDKQKYDYEEPIKLTYRLINVSNHPIKISIMPNIRLTERLEILHPDGTRARYIGLHADFFGPRPEDYKTLRPGDELTDTISISQGTHWLHQTGRYTVNLHIIPWGGGIRYGFMTWSYWISSKVHFNIEPPTTDQVDALLERFDAGGFDDMGKTYHQLSELNKSGLFPKLKTRPLIPLDYYSGYTPNSVAQGLTRKVSKLKNDALVLKYIEMLPDRGAIKVLTELGDDRAFKPLQQIAINGLPEAALALKQLGDDKTVKWCTELAKRKLIHYNKEEREKGAEMIRTLQQPSKIKQRSWEHQNALTVQGFYDNNDSPSLAANWADIIEKAVTLDGLKELIEHDIPVVRRGAAYELAYLGDKSGIHLIEQDLQANEKDTRMHARSTLLKLLLE